MKKVLVLGTGLVGSFIANKLCEEGCEITTLDIKLNTKLNPKIKQATDDISSFWLACDWEDELANKFDLVVNALPGSLGYETLERLIKQKVNVIDISFMPEDFMQLNDIAKESNVTAICDFGFAPGISHMWTKKLELEGFKTIEIYVGGLPLDKSLEYKAPFSPIDVIEEYTRPARFIDSGKERIGEPFKMDYGYDMFWALKPLQISRWHDCGLSGFISDGLRSLLKTSKVDNLVEYTLRYRPHFQFISTLKGKGFFKKPHLKNTAKVLIDDWKMTSDIKDYSIMEVKGYKDDIFGRSLRLLDKHDGKNHSMARATGLPAVAMALAVLNGEYKEKGIIPPEQVAENTKVYNKIMTYLKKNGIIIQGD